MDDEEYFADPDHAAEFEDHQFDDHQLDSEEIWRRALADWDELVGRDEQIDLTGGVVDLTDEPIDVTDDSVVNDWKQMPLNGQNYWFASNYKNGRCLNTCSLHALNSTIMNTDSTRYTQPVVWTDLPRNGPNGPPTPRRPQGRVRQMWMPNTFGGDLVDKYKQVTATWDRVFEHIDPLPGASTVIRGDAFLRWARHGQAPAGFKFAVAGLPIGIVGHAVSIVKAPHNNDLILIDSEMDGPRLLSDVARSNPGRFTNRSILQHPHVTVYRDV